jgi:multidrug efflux pump subunit AcrA (membrane-fusion protein)
VAATRPSGPGTGAGGAGVTSSTSGFIVLTGLSGLLIHADFAETDAAKIKMGSGASVTVNALPTGSMSATVAQIDPTSSTNSSVVQYGVTFTVARQPAGLRPGQSVSVSVITAEATNTLSVPSSAVTTAGGQHTVRVVSAGGQERTVAVTIGVQGDTSTQIMSGLTAGEKVATSATSGSSSGGFPAGGFPGGRFGGLGGG